MTPEIAKQILVDGAVYGKSLSPSQRNHFAQIAGTDINGNALEEENETEEYKRGGQKRLPKKYTSKNIQSSLNTLMLRNEMVFGPAGKHNIYVPDLDKNYRTMNYKKKQGGMPEAFPQQPTDKQFFSPTFIPHAPKAFYGYGGANPPAFPQQPPFNVFMTNAPWHPVYNQGGQPCFDCGGNYMEDGGEPVDQFAPFQDDKGQWRQNAKINGNLWYRTQADKDANKPFTKPAIMQDAQGNWVPYAPSQDTGTHVMPDGTVMPNGQMKKGGQNWIGKANKSMKAKGTKGAFTEYCGGHVTAACIERGLNSSDPTIRKRASFAKAMRSIAHKQFGGDAPQGMDMDNIVDSKQEYFKNFLGKNAMNAWADEEAMNLADMHDQAMAAYGMEVNGDQMNYQNMQNAQMMQDKINMGKNQSAQDFSNMYGQGMNLAATANPYYEMMQQNMHEGGNTQQQEWVNPYGVPQYGVAPNLLPYNAQPYYKFKTNYAPGPGSFLPPGFNPSGAKNFNYDYRGRFFGAGPRRVKMSWDEFSQNGQQTPGPNNMNSPIDPLTGDELQLQYQFPDKDPNPNMAKWGGSYKAGGEYELNASQIQQIMDDGGEIEYID